MMIKRLKNSAGPTSVAASIRISRRGLPGGARSRCLCAFSIMTIAASTIAPIAMAMPPRLMMLEPRPSAFMAANAMSTPTGSIRIATRALRTCSRNTMQTSATIGAFLEQRAAQVLDGGVDQGGAVIDRLNVHALRQAAGQLGNALLDVVDDIERVGAEALQDDAAGDLALAVEFGQAPAFVRSQLDPRHVLQENRRAALVLEDDLLQIGDALQIAAPAHHELEFGQLDRAPADIHVAGADGVAHLGERDAEAAQALGIDDDVVLLDEAADAGDLGDAFGLGEAVAHVPVLQSSAARRASGPWRAARIDRPSRPRSRRGRASA